MALLQLNLASTPLDARPRAVADSLQPPELAGAAYAVLCDVAQLLNTLVSDKRQVYGHCQHRPSLHNTLVLTGKSEARSD